MLVFHGQVDLFPLLTMAFTTGKAEVILNGAKLNSEVIGMFSAIHGLYECLRWGCLHMIGKMNPWHTSLVPALGEFARETEFFGHEPFDAAHESDDCPFLVSRMIIHLPSKTE